MSGKSKEEVAFELVSKLKGVGVWGENNRKEILDMYAECLEATSGLRQMPGRKPVAQQATTQQAPAQQAQVQQPAAQQPAAAQQAALRQQQHVDARQQQQRVQQAYQQQQAQR